MTTVRVSATSANLGPGFDCLGLALGLYLQVTACRAGRDAFEYRGEGRVEDHPDNLVHQGFRAAYRKVGEPAPTVRLLADNAIPLARGLGSSSAALVAGIALADAMMGAPLGREGVFQLAAGLEGHPDNAAPAVYGGFTVSAERPGGGFESRSLPVPASWRFLFGVPAFELPTQKAREVVPERVSRRDAVLTASRASLWTAAVALDEPELLRVAAQDVLHEPYREPLVPGLARCRGRLYESGAVAAFLSGAGPTLAAVCLDEATRASCEAALRSFVGPQGKVLALEPARGYCILSQAEAEEVLPA